MDLTYNLSRDDAAKILGVSTRTIDRYIKSGKVGYIKESKKILLATEDIERMKSQQGRTALPETQIVSSSSGEQSTSLVVEAPPQDLQQNIEIAQTVTDALEEFSHLLSQKDSLIEKKNQTIFSLQHTVGTLEGKLQQSIALPDHTQQTDQLLMEKHKAEALQSETERELQRLQRKNMITLISIIACGIVLISLARIFLDGIVLTPKR